MKQLALILFLTPITLMGQFMLPENKIKFPDVVDPQFNYSIIKEIGRPIKKLQEESSTKEYDREGNLILETTTDRYSSTKIIYKYKNKILIEKKRTIETNKVAIENENRLETKKSEQIGYDEQALLNSNNSVMTYSAIIDKKGRIIEFKSEASSHSKVSYNETKIKYNEENIIEVESHSTIDKFSYKNNILINHEKVNKNNFSNFTTIKEYKYDQNNNLTAIIIKEVLNNGKVNSYSNDSARYDYKNRIILAADIFRCNKYVYDDSDQISKIIEVKRDGSEFEKNYEYENGLLTKIYFNNFNKKLNRDVRTDIRYHYESNKISLIETYYNNEIVGKIEYVYQNNLLKYKKEYSFKEKDDFRFKIETSYNYDGKYLVINNNEGKKLTYEFYEN